MNHHKLTIGIQGISGSYHEQVAHLFFGEKAQLVFLHTFQQVFAHIKSAEQITHAVVAIANNRYGFIPDAFSQLMIHHPEISIVGEVYLPIKHQLMANPGSKLSDITEVHSQAPALGQCGMYLQKNLPNAVLIEEEDTAGSARIVQDSAQPNKAAIASMRAAEKYGLDLIAPDVQDDPNNITRFYIIKRRGDADTILEANKTTALLKTPQKAGSLVDALIPFKACGINISTLHSTFLPNTGFEMQFLVEFDAGISDKRMQLATKELSENDAELTILGSYKGADGIL